MTTEVIGSYKSLGSFANIPAWARDAIAAGAYQQGRADALKYAFDEMMKKHMAR